MRRTKSLLFVLVLALMVFGMVSAAFAASFSDVATDPAKKDIFKLNALGVIDGYPDGTFKPAGEITRAEFAKIAVIIAGLKDSADFLKNSPSQFSDVAAGQWYTGWVNVAASQGFVKGYPDGTFSPDAKVTSAEVIAVMLRILGYDDRLPGDWPVDYLAKAGKLGITDDVTFSASAPATRAIVCQLAAATLEEDLVDYDNDKEDFVKDEDRLTLLEDNFDSAEVETDAYVASVKNNNGDLTMTVVLDKETTPTVVTLDTDCFIADVPGPWALEFNYVDFIIGENDDDDMVVKWVAPVQKNIVTDKGGEGDTDTTQIELNGKTYDYSSDFVLYSVNANGVTVKSSGGTFTPAQWADLVENYANFVKVGLNDDNEIVQVALYVEDVPADEGLATIFDDSNLDNLSVTIVDEVDTKNGDVDGKDGNNIKDLTDEDVNEYVALVKGGALVKLEDLKENDILMNFGAVKGYDEFISVVSSTVTGELKKAYSDALTIDTTKYDYNDIYAEDASGDEVALEDLGTLVGNTVNAYFDAYGNVRYITGETSDSSSIVGVVIKSGLDTTKGQDTRWVKLFNEQGKEVTLDFDDNYYDDEDVAKIDTVLGDSDAEDFDPATDIVVVKYELNSDGNIDNLKSYTAGDIDSKDMKDGFDGSDDIYAKYNRVPTTTAGEYKYVTDKTIIVDWSDPEDADLSTWADVEDSDSVSGVVYYDGKDAKLLVVTDGASSNAGNNAVYLDSYEDGSDTYVELFYNGEVIDKELGAINAAGYDDVTDFEENDALEVTFDGDKVDIDDVNNTADVIGEDGVDTGDSTITLEDGTVISVAEGAQIVDTTGDDPVAIELGDLNEGDNIYIMYDQDDTDVISMIVLVD